MRRNVSSALAKLSLPRLGGDALPRERLFARLDTLCVRPLLWIEAPAGAGKTTLVASYVEARKLPVLWYEIDSGDCDAGSFFHHLAVAAAPLLHDASHLPRLTGEYAAQPQGFSRRFFRELFARLAHAKVLVFDNFDEANGSMRLDEILRDAVTQAPAHINLIVLSRSAPPSSFVRLAANGRMAVLDGTELLLREDESVAIAQRRGINEGVARRLHREAEGWAAGFRLMMEGTLRVGEVDAPGQATSKQELFDYFVEQIFKVASKETQNVLLDLSLLPSMTTPMACAISGNPRAGEMIDCLARHQLFAQRRRNGEGTEPDSERWTYRFHALFQAFLRQQVQKERGTDGFRALQLKSADLLQKWGWPEVAVELYLRAGAWQPAVVLIKQLAERMLREVRYLGLLDWIEALPQELVTADQWLLYFTGSAMLSSRPGDSRQWLERAYALAAQRSDTACMLRVVPAIIDAIFLEYSQFTPIDKWIGVLRELLEQNALISSPDAELRVRAALLSALLYRHGNTPELPALAERTLELAIQQSDVNLRATAAAWLLSFGANTGHPEFASRVLPVAAALVEHPDVSPLRKGACAYFMAWTHISMCEVERAEAGAKTLLRLSEELCLPRLQRFAAIIGLWAELIAQQPDGMRSWICAFEKALESGHAYDLASQHAMRAWLAMVQGQPSLTAQHADIALPAYEQVGSPWHRLMIRALLLWSAVELDDEPRARHLLIELRELVQDSGLELYAIYAYQAEAWMALKANNKQQIAAKLATLFVCAKRYGVGMPMRFIPAWMPRLCAEAIRHGVEVVYVRNLIRTYRWPAPEPQLAGWPWPVKVYTLGRFSIWADDEPISFSTKAPRKALALLKALICLGGAEIRDHQLIDALWQDDEADAARAAFNVTLHRLRRLLGHNDAIEVIDGCLTLNPKVVWVDAFAYEHLLENGESLSPVQVDEALVLYRGPLLPTDQEESWSAVARERIRAKFLHHLGQRARELESERRWEEAIALYLRGLDADSMSESFYQGLMRCHRECGRHAEALSLYWRLRQTLSVSLGIAPSSETEVLFQNIGQAARAAPF